MLIEVTDQARCELGVDKKRAVRRVRSAQGVLPTATAVLAQLKTRDGFKTFT